MAKLSIIYRKVFDLTPRSGNPRTHSKKQLTQIAASIRHFGFTNPVIVDKNGGIIAGHGRVEAAKLIDMEEVPTVRLDDMSEADIRAYVIADNRLAENAGWDEELLGLEFAYISELDLGFDPTVTGFELAEIDSLIDAIGQVQPANDPADATPEVGAGPAVTEAGDVWEIGQHRLICADATIAENYALLMNEEKAAMVFVDPPYNVPIDGHVSGLGKVRHREFAMASGEMSSGQFARFLTIIFSLLAKFSANGSMHFVCMDWRHIAEVLVAGNANYSEFKNLCVWAKPQGGMGSLFRSAHELIFVFKSGSEPHINNVELGRHGRYRTNVWTHPGANSFGSARGDPAMHPTMKPVALVKDAILDCSRRKDIILDAFAGSGTTLIAAHKAGRRGYGIEIDPLYCDTIVRRMRKVCKLEAVRVSDGRTFDEVAAERAAAPCREDAA